MIHLPHVALDLDGVVANLTQRVLDIAKGGPWDLPERWEDYYETSFPEDLWSELSLRKEFWLSIEPHLPLPEFVPGAYVTARPDSARRASTEWIRKAGLPEAPVYVGHNKAVVMRVHDLSVLVDDQDQFVNQVDEWANMKGYLLNRPWNANALWFAGERIDSINDIIEREKNAVHPS